MAPEIIDFKAENTPYGGEVKLSWSKAISDSPEEMLEPGWVLLIFKRVNAAVLEEEIKSYIDNPVPTSIPKGLFFFRVDFNLPQFIDINVDVNKRYFYSAVLIKEKAGEPTEQSDIVNSDVLVQAFGGKFNTVSTKSELKKELERISKAVTAISEVKIPVLLDFPIEEVPAVYFVITRASGESAFTFWSNVSTSSRDQLVTGAIDSDVLLVTWEVGANNPELRDKITNIMRAARFHLIRHMMQVPGVLDCRVTFIGDGQDMRIENSAQVYGQMLVNFLINTQAYFSADELATAVLTHLNKFSTK